MNIQIMRKCFLKSEFQFHIKTIIQNVKSVDNVCLAAPFASKNMYKIQNGRLNVQMNQ